MDTAMKRILLAIMIVMIAGQAWGANYSVCASGCTHTSIGAAISAGNGTAGPHTLLVKDGSWNETIELTNANWVDSIVSGESKTGTIIARDGYHCAVITVTGTTLRNVTLRATSDKRALYVDTTNITVQDAILEGDANHTDDLMSVSANLNIKRTAIRTTYASGKYVFQVYGSFNVTLEYSQLEGYGAGGIGLPIKWSSTGTLTLNNTNYFDVPHYNIWMNQPGTINVTNSILQAGTYALITQPCILAEAGTVNISKSMLIPNLLYAATTSGAGTFNLTGNITDNEPKFVSNKGGFIIPRIDDSLDPTTYAQPVADVLATYGMYGTWYINSGTWNPAHSAALRTLVAQGRMEVGSHGRSHTRVDYTHGLNFSQAGGNNCTVAFNGTTITLECDGTDYDNTLDTSNASYDTLGEIITALNGVKGWTVAKSTTGGQDASYIGNLVKATSFASMGATAEPCDLDFDRTGIAQGFFKDEVEDTIAAVNAIVNGAGNVTDPQTGATYTARTFAVPFSTGDATALTALKASSFIGGGMHSGLTKVLNNQDVHNIYVLGTTIKGDGSEAQTRARAKQLGFNVARSGFIVYLLAHNATELSTEQWGWILDEFSKINNLTVTSAQKAIDYITTSGLWSCAAGTCTRTYTTYGDQRLKPGSPAINAGVDLCSTLTTATDFRGRSVCVGGALNKAITGPAPDIGAYEGWKQCHPVKTGGRYRIMCGWLP